MRNIKFLLLVFFLIVIVANGCWEEERSALLELQANIMSSNGELLVDWAGYNANGFTDCCFWKSVKCSLETGRVIKLDLGSERFGSGDDWRFNASLFLPFKSLQVLLSSYRNITGWTKNEGIYGQLPNLKILKLQFNHIHPKDLLSSLCWISSLEVLKLGAHVDTSLNVPTYNSSTSKKCGGLTNLRKLWFEGYEINDINILSALGGLTNLEKLILNNNNFNSTIFSSLKIFPNLEYLELLHNNIESFATTKGNKIMSSLRNLLLGSSYSNSSRVIQSLKSFSTLKPLSYEYSDLTSPTILYGWCELKHIQELDFSANNFRGTLPSCFGNLTSLRRLSFSWNNLRGNIASHSIWRRFTSLEYLDIVDNQFDVSLSFSQFSNNTKLIYLDVGSNTIIPDTEFQNWIPNFQLEFFAIQGCKNLQKLPSFLHYQYDLRKSILIYLNMSQNYLEGPIPSKISGIHLHIHLFIDSRCIRDNTRLLQLDLSMNHLKGSIPVEICNLKLIQVLAISENRLSGSIPSCVNSLPLEHIHLEKNQLGGELGHVLFNFSSLITLDLGYNNFTGNIPHTIGALNTLNYLLLSNNQLEGEIPTQICMLNKLSIVDISFNKIYGPLLPCLSYLTQAKKDAKISKTNYATTSTYSCSGLESDIFLMDMETQVQFSTKRNSYTYKGSILKYMSGIDLSSNRLTGEIPVELGNMSNIPNTKYLLQSTENREFRLSYNRLNGRIPVGLLELNSLAVFSVAYNNLSGAVPDFKAQFGTFNKSSYEGNPYLCGYPLDNTCGIPKLSNTSKINGGEESSVLEGIQCFYIGFVVSYGAILLGLAAALCFNRYWRKAWFRMIEALMFYCYYFVLDNIVTPIKSRMLVN
ncbi:hypothetical protein R3W88_033093 [Solanum pinnatisectum]|uniref:Leucine-rich repeat-containing N-terminal plant-type domain-containing protein n=1 Tax=Solanum pinnatisectum TaxID=50273 RepID=A0AAV9K2C9_9SOLN|nr:hypothetical protein R3W88_033093 [Solanum pinnatisectum]